MPIFLRSNGVEPDLDGVPATIPEVIDVAPGAHVSTWEHLHAAKNASEFMAWLRGGSKAHD